MNYSTISFILLGVAALLYFFFMIRPSMAKGGVQEGKAAQFRPLPVLDTPMGFANPISYKHLGKQVYDCEVEIGGARKSIIIDEVNDYLEPKNSKVETIFGSGCQQWEHKPYAKEHIAAQTEKQATAKITELQEKNEILDAEKKLAETTTDLQLDKKVEDASALAKAGKQPAQRFGQR